MDLNKQYWFYIEPYVYTKVEEDSFIMYNTLDNEYIISNNKSLMGLVKSAITASACGTVLLNPNKFDNEILSSFIFDVRNKFMGDVLPHNLTVKPVQLPPIVNIRNDIRRVEEMQPSKGENILKYLSEISIYLNTFCGLDCKYCHLYHKQFPFCFKSNQESQVLSLDLLIKIVRIVENTNSVEIINLFAGDLLMLNDDWCNISTILLPIRKKCRLNLYWKNIANINDKMKQFFEDRIVVLVDYSNENIYDLIGFNVRFIVGDEREYNYFESIISEKQLDKYEFLPFCNFKNWPFFQEYVFLNEEDIVTDVKLKDIFRNMKMNKYFFGKIIILPSGDVRSNMNGNTLGNLNQSSILDIIYNEVTVLDSFWFKTRDNAPCRNCLFQYLCPPISNYEIALNKTNLCTVK